MTIIIDLSNPKTFDSDLLRLHQTLSKAAEGGASVDLADCARRAGLTVSDDKPLQPQTSEGK